MSYYPDASATGFDFRKSSYSGGNENCVEYALNLRHEVAVCDSKNPSGPALAFTTSAHAAFIAAVANGEFDFNLL